MVRKLTVISIALIVLNIILLTLIFAKRNSRPGEHRPRHNREAFDERLVRRLDFSPDQRQAYRDQTRAHKQRHQELSLHLLEIKEEIHGALAGEDQDALDTLLPKMDSLHSLREREVIGYVQGILAVCNEGQKEQFLEVLRTSVEGRRGFHRRRL